MSRSELLMVVAFSISLMLGVSANATDGGSHSMLSRFKVGQAVVLQKAQSGGFNVTIVPPVQGVEPEHDVTIVCEVGRDFIVVESDNGRTKMISASAIDVVTDPMDRSGHKPAGFAGTWHIGDSIQLNIVVDGDQVSATYPKLDGMIEGTIFKLSDGRDVLIGQWKTFAGQGTITLVLDASGSSFNGGWHNLNPNPEFAHLNVGVWSGNRILDRSKTVQTDIRSSPSSSAEQSLVEGDML